MLITVAPLKLPTLHDCSRLFQHLFRLFLYVLDVKSGFAWVGMKRTVNVEGMHLYMSLVAHLFTHTITRNKTEASKRGNRSTLSITKNMLRGNMQKKERRGCWRGSVYNTHIRACVWETFGNIVLVTFMPVKGIWIKIELSGTQEMCECVYVWHLPPISNMQSCKLFCCSSAVINHFYMDDFHSCVRVYSAG